MEKLYLSIGSSRVAYIDEGEGPPVVFIHGLPTSSYLWETVIESLRGEFRCIAPDLMGLGDTQIQPDSDLAMPSQARMIIDLLDALEIKRISLVAHDQGGAAAQIIATRYPERVSKLALINVVCYDNWPVPGVRFLRMLARLPGSSWLFGSRAVRRIANRLGMGLQAGFYDKSKATPEMMAEFARETMSSAERVRRYKRFLLAGDARHTIEVAPDLKKLGIPTLILWGRDDPFIDLKWAQKLADDIPGAFGPIIIPECGHFVPRERPDRVSGLLRGLMVSGK